MSVKRGDSPCEKKGPGHMKRGSSADTSFPLCLTPGWPNLILCYIRMTTFRFFSSFQHFPLTRSFCKHTPRFQDAMPIFVSDLFTDNHYRKSWPDDKTIQSKGDERLGHFMLASTSLYEAEGLLPGKTFNGERKTMEGVEMGDVETNCPPSSRYPMDDNEDHPDTGIGEGMMEEQLQLNDQEFDTALGNAIEAMEDIWGE